MALSFYEYVGNGSTKEFACPPYINKSHIHAYVDGVEVGFAWLTSATIQLTSAPPGGSVVVIQRKTDISYKAGEYKDGSLADVGTLTKIQEQLLYATQEAYDNLTAFQVNPITNTADADNRRIINVATPEDPQDAATKAWVEALPNSAAQLALNAQAAAEVAKGAAEDAQAAAEAALAGMEKGVPGGVAPLDGGNKLPTSHLTFATPLEATTGVGSGLVTGSMLERYRGHGGCRLILGGDSKLYLQGTYDNLSGLLVMGNQLYRFGQSEGLATTSLAASTLYYIYAFWTGTAVRLMPFGITPVVNTGGIWILPGYPEYTFVGWARTNASTQWADSLNQRFVVSYFNPKLKPLYATLAASRTVTSTSAIKVSLAADDLEFICFHGPYWLNASAMTVNSVAATNTYFALTLNGTVFLDAYTLSYRPNASQYDAMSVHKTDAPNGYVVAGWAAGSASGNITLQAGAGTVMSGFIMG